MLGSVKKLYQYQDREKCCGAHVWSYIVASEMFTCVVKCETYSCLVKSGVLCMLCVQLSPAKWGVKVTLCIVVW